MEIFLFLFKVAMVGIPLATITYFLLKRYGGQLGSLGAMTSGGWESTAMKVVGLLLLIFLVKYVADQPEWRASTKVLIIIHIGAFFYLFSSGMPLDSKRIGRILILGGLGYMLWFSPPGGSLRNEIDSFWPYGVTEKSAQAGVEGDFFTGNGGLFSGGKDSKTKIYHGPSCSAVGFNNLPEVTVPSKNDAVKMATLKVTGGQPIFVNLSRIEFSKSSSDNEYMYDIDQSEEIAVDANGKSIPADLFFDQRKRRHCQKDGAPMEIMVPKKSFTMVVYDAEL